MKNTRITSLLVGGLALLTLSGCAGLHPGAAAQVGDVRITRSHVDDITRIRCALTKTQGGAAQPRGTVQQGTLNVLVESARDNLYGQAVHASYDEATLRTQTQQFADSLKNLSASDKAAIVAEYRSSVKGALLLADVGAKSLKAKGTAKPGIDVSVNEGSRLAAAWAKKHLDVEIDPRFNPGRSGQAGGGDGSVSRPVSAYAKAAAGTPGAAFVTALPSGMRCG